MICITPDRFNSSSGWRTLDCGSFASSRKPWRLTVSVIQSIAEEYTRYKALAESAIAQVGDEELGNAGQNGGNSIEMLIRHIAGNLKSRFTDFRSSDGEKPWRR